MKWKGHLIVCGMLTLAYAKWLSSHVPGLSSPVGIALLFGFVAMALLGTYNGHVRLSPDFDTYPGVKQLIGHRSILSHSPLVPYLLQNSLGVHGTLRRAFVWNDFTAILTYGFAFGWCVHIFADALYAEGLNGWDIPGNMPKNVRRWVGLVCVLATAIYFATRFL